MKEITAIIRMDMVSKTKDAILKLGFPSVTCKKVMGRGKKRVAYELFQSAITGNQGLSAVMAEQLGEQLSEEHRLLPKRLLLLVVEDADVSSIVDAIIKVNQNGNAGNGKIFIANVDDAIRVRTGETGTKAI